GPRPALTLIDALAAAGDLDRYHLLHAARADLLRRLGSSEEAAKSYARALALVTNDAERRFLARRLREVQRSDRPYVARRLGIRPSRVLGHSPGACAAISLFVRWPRKC